MELEPSPVVVTDHDQEIAETRRGLAEQAQRDYETVAEILGYGHSAYGYWVMTDNMGLAPEKKFPCARMNDGRGWWPNPPPNLIFERRPDKFFTYTDGRFIACAMRWTQALQVIAHDYKPKSALRLAQDRAIREDRAITKMAVDELPLFAGDILSGKWRPKKDKKRRFRDRIK